MENSGPLSDNEKMVYYGAKAWVGDKLDTSQESEYTRSFGNVLHDNILDTYKSSDAKSVNSDIRILSSLDYDLAGDINSTFAEIRADEANRQQRALNSSLRGAELATNDDTKALYNEYIEKQWEGSPQGQIRKAYQVANEIKQEYPDNKVVSVVTDVCVGIYTDPMPQVGVIGVFGEGIQAGTKVILEGSEDVVSQIVKDSSKGWKVGDDVYDLTAKGNEPSWNTVRQRYWKNEATDPAVGEIYGAENIDRMKKGYAPQRYNPDKGGMESMELSHEPIPRRDGGKDFVPRWPQDHAEVDPYRHPGY